MKNLICICLLTSLLFSFTGNIEMVNITGKVVDKATQSPLAYATITISDAATKEILSGEITNESGTFSLSIPAGKYDIKIDYLTFNSFILENIDVSKNYNMSLIELEPDVAQLAEIEVIGERTTVEYKLDKKVFNVGKDLVSKGGAVTDILDNVPSVSVDAGGAVSLRGNTNVQILINGKPSILTANNGLEQLPADMVMQIEVITNPSARYEASGTAGIINVILKKNKDGGFGGSIQLTAGIPTNYRTNINVNYKTEKYNIFSNIGYRYTDFSGKRIRHQVITRNGETSILDQFEEQNRNDDHYNIYVGGDYYFNDKNTLTASYYHDMIVNTDRTDLNYTYSNENNEIDSVITQFENYREPQNFNQLELDYIKTFDKKGQKWSTSLVYDFWNDDENENITQQHLIPFNEGIRNIKSRDIESSKDLLIQSDFVSPLTKQSNFEAGFRGQIRRITSDYNVTVDGEILNGYDNLLDYDERIYGLYAQYGSKTKKFNYLLGLRTEYAHIGTSDHDNQFNNDKKSIALFPTAHLTYNISDLFNVQLSYSRRINRPRFWQLNPFGGFSDSRNLFVGNPNLNPAYTDSYELGILKRWDKITLNPSLYYQHNTDFFQFVTTINDDNNFLMMPINLSHENRLGFEVSTTYNPVKWLRLSAEFNYYQFQQIGEYQGINYDTEDDNWSARINSRMRFNKGLTVQGTFRYRGENQSGQVLNKAQHSLDFAISKDLFQDKASISLNARNILDSRIDERIVTGENYRLESTTKRIRRRVSATFVYRFNRKKNERDRMGG